MNLLQETKLIMNQYGIHANKKLGQNFLVDEATIHGIIKAAEISKKDCVIEIGPGLGTLTSRLLESAGKVIAIELDKNVLPVLDSRFHLHDNFQLIHQDVLKTDLQSIISTNLTHTITSCKIVANLPYYITTPIIMKLLEDNLNLVSITVMVQREVAERLTAIPGKSKNTGSISHYIYYYSDAKIVLDVPRTFFFPAPDVDSSVINLSLLKQPRIEVKDKDFFFQVIKIAFSQKRKTLVNSLINNHIGSSKEQLEQMLIDLGLNPKSRPEEFSLQDFANIVQTIKK